MTQKGDFQNTLWLLKEAGHARPRVVRLHLREEFRTGKPTETESGFALARGWGRVGRAVTVELGLAGQGDVTLTGDGCTVWEHIEEG